MSNVEIIIADSCEKASQRLYPTKRYFKPVEEKEKPGLTYENIEQNLYPKSNTQKIQGNPNLEKSASNNFKENPRLAETDKFIKVLSTEYPKCSDNFSTEFTFPELVQRFKNYCSLSERFVFEQFDSIKIYRIIQRLFHTGIITETKGSPRTYKLDYSKSRNPYINSNIF
jgi:hypothetical protein